MVFIRKKSLKSIILLFIIGFFLLNCLFFLLLQYPNGFSSEFVEQKKNNVYPHPIDIVYTWVNGSDSQLIKQLNYFKATLYLDKNLDFEKDVTRSHCPFELCGFHDHFMVSGVPHDASRPDLIIPLVSDFLEKALNTSSIHVTYIASVDQSILSRRSGIVLQSSVSISSLFFNHSEFAARLPRFSATVSQILIGASGGGGGGGGGGELGLPIADHVFISGLPEMRDATSDDKLRRDILAQLPNGTTIVKASSTGFVIGLPAGVAVDHLNSTFNCSLVSPNAHLVRAMLILDIDLVAILSDLTESRFQDNDELKYSLRSLDMFADFFRHVFIVTNGQVPAWLNTANPRVSVVPHWKIFSNRSHLPTFNSASIEANLHNIPGLADHFIYLNDDVFFGKKVFVEDFYSASTGYKVQFGWMVPNCVEACPSSWLADGFCDSDCNVADCQWDAGDCIKTQGKPGIVNFQQLSNYSIGNIDNFQSALSGQISDYCSQGCNTNWLADRYCDQACNVDVCGYDLGDCGDSGILTLPTDKLHQEFGQIVPVTNGSRAVVVNLHDLVGPHDNVTRATIDDSREVLGSSYAVKYRVVVIVLRDPAFCTGCYLTHNQSITVNVTVSRFNSSVVNIQFLLVLNAPPKLLPNRTRTPQMIGQSTRSWFMSSSILDDAHPTQMPPSLSLISRSQLDPPLSVEQLEWERPLEMSQYRLLLQDGLISPAGYRHLLAELWHLSWSAPAARDMGLTALGSTDDDDDFSIDKLQWGFLPWERIGGAANSTLLDSGAPDGAGRQAGGGGGASTSRRVLDLYADSLRHSNRLLSRAYSVTTQRRVPAHGPHFISTAVLARAHGRFRDAWTRTSAHRFRSPTDLQFAFSYFYYLMSENVTVSMAEMLASVDTDHSGSLSANELRSLIVRIHDNETVSFAFIDRVLSDINETCGGPASSPATTGGAGGVGVPELAACFNWTGVYSPRQRPRYPFTTHEDSDLSFIMISANRDKVLQHLDELRRAPKKFFCLNDNLPNSAEPALIRRIRTDVTQFLDFMFPVPSQFEMVVPSIVPGEGAISGTRNSNAPALVLRHYLPAIKVVGIASLILLLLIGLKKLLILSRECRWSWRLSFRFFRNVDNNLAYL